MTVSWIVMKWNLVEDRWEETDWRSPNRQSMEAMLQRIQRSHLKDIFCVVADPRSIEHKATGIQVWDYQGEGTCWETQRELTTGSWTRVGQGEPCTLNPSYEVKWQGRFALVCHRHIVRYLRQHAELRTS